MRSNFQVLLLLCVIAVSARAQNDQTISLNIGDPAPPLRMGRWLKGEPIQKFKTGKTYVVEFWATWCTPCRAEMPHLSDLARKYRDKITVLSVNIYENETKFIPKIKAFVDSMGDRMDYRVVMGDSSFFAAKWFDASGSRGLPFSFVVNAQGKLAWMGHPKDLGEVLPAVTDNSWDIKKALAKRNLERRLLELDLNAHYELANYWADPLKPDDLGKPDSALFLINEIVTKEPLLKYAPFIAYQTFAALLKTNPPKAYEYGKAVMKESTFEYPYDAIIPAVESYADKLNLSAEIYQLGAEAQQVEIDEIPYPENVNLAVRYNQMATWYSRANDKSKAIDAQQKAIEALKARKSFSATDLEAFESRLQQYKNM